MRDEFMVLHALSLTQPWATLIAIGAKERETRCWPTQFRGWIAIHASKGFPTDCQWLCGQEPYAAELHRAGFIGDRSLPRGKVIAVGRLTECIATRAWAPPENSNEYAFGNYEAIDSGNGKPRYSFKLEDVRKLREPLDCKGALGIWRLPRVITEADLA
jgi:hypothetical protein